MLKRPMKRPTAQDLLDLLNFVFKNCSDIDPTKCKSCLEHTPSVKPMMALDPNGLFSIEVLE